MAFLKFRGNSTTPTKPSSTSAANAPLTNADIDGNFASLNDSKLESSDAASTNTPFKIVARNASGSFAAGTITSNGITLTGNTGTVTSVSGSGTVSGLSLSGTVTSSGSLTLGGSLSLTLNQVVSALGYYPVDPSGDVVANTIDSIPNSALGSGIPNTTTFLRGDRTWATVTGGATLSDDNTSDSVQYLGMSRNTSGAWTSAYIATTKLTFNPSTGILNSIGFTSTSDSRSKSEVEPITNALDKTLSLNGYTFYLNSNKDRRQTGVIAQEVLKVLPEAVYGSEDTQYSVAYGSMIGLLIESIKELNSKIINLQNQLDNK
jgi:hypothetical protein